MLRDAAVFAALLIVSGGAAAYGFEPVRTLLPDVAAQALAIGDVSGDGLDDLVIMPGSVGSQDHSEILVALQQANGLLATPVAVEFGTQGLRSGSVGLADMDDDGALDIVVGEDRRMTILRNEGALQFSAHSIVEQDGSETFDFDDVDGDGHLDIVGTSSETHDGTFNIYHGDGSGGIRDLTTVSLPGTFEPDLVDINGDGRRDLAYLHSGSLVILWRDEHGFSSDPTSIPLGLNLDLTDIAFSDFNADGRMDFAIVKDIWPGPMLALYEQRAGGRFWASGALKSYLAPGTPRFHDMDGDGREDLIVSHHFADGLVGLYSAKSKGLQIESLFDGYAVNSLHQMAIGDLNGDGRQDIATAMSLPGVSFLEGRDTAIEADLAVYLGLAPSAAAIRLQNHSAHTATAPIHVSALLDVRTGPLDIGALPAGCQHQTWNMDDVLVECYLVALAPGAHTTITVPLLIDPPRSAPNFLNIDVATWTGAHDLRPDNDTASKRMTIWPSLGTRRK